MTIELWITFVAASLVLLLIPGPTILTVISYSMTHGRRANIPLILAVALGDSTALALSILGLGAILAASAAWFNAIKIIGGLYLLYLGVKLLRSNAGSGADTGADTGANANTKPNAIADTNTNLASVTNSLNKNKTEIPDSMQALFFNTWLITALNPKGIIFFVAFLPQFVNPNNAGAPQLWILSFTFVLLATLNATLYAIFASAARRKLTSATSRKRFNVVGGLMLCTAGLWALTATQQSQAAT